VGFRWATARTGERLGLAGAVRNCQDGSVEMAVRGSEAGVAAFAEWLTVGPPGAGVAEVAEIPPPLPLPESGMRIVRGA
jgi:acylphosphatase